MPKMTLGQSIGTPAKGQPREDLNQAAFRVAAEVNLAGYPPNELPCPCHHQDMPEAHALGDTIDHRASGPKSLYG
jgi:hypothetical protein